MRANSSPSKPRFDPTVADPAHTPAGWRSLTQVAHNLSNNLRIITLFTPKIHKIRWETKHRSSTAAATAVSCGGGGAHASFSYLAPLIIVELTTP